MSFRSYATRFQVDADEERDDGYLYANGRGRAGAAPKGIIQSQPFGFGSRPVPGSVGVQFALGGDHSTSILFNPEHPDFRPKLPLGGSSLYDRWGGILKWIGEGLVIDTKNRAMTINASDWTITAPQGVTINGPLTVNGNIQLNGSLSATGTVVDGNGDGGA